MTEEIDPEKCNFGNFRSSVTLILTLDRVEVILVRTSGRSLPKHQIRSKSEKLLVVLWCTYRQTYRQTNRPEFQFIRSSL